MKKIFYHIQRLLLTLLSLLVVGCTGDFPHINRNPNQVTEDQLEAQNYRIGTNIKALQGLVIPIQEHLYQFNEALMGCPYAGYIGATTNSWLAKFETYNPPIDWLKSPFVDILDKTYTSYRGVITGTNDEVAIALANLYRVAIMHRVTDIYGPIPYSKIVENKGGALTVGYDTQQEVYVQMFKELDAVIADLTYNISLPAEAFRKYDNVYFGDISKWIKYANSLKLRLAMRLTYVDLALAQQKAEEAVLAGVIVDNVDNARMSAAENRTTLLFNTWGDHRVGADIISYMNGYNDPRREKMFTTTTGDGTNEANRGFYGIRIGIDTESKDACVKTYSNVIVTEQTPYLWMNAAEVTFLRAEGALRGWSMGGDAKALYEQAIALSFEEHGATGAAVYAANTTNKPEKYTDPLNKHSAAAPMSTITIGWELGNDPDVVERNLERIITQKWIAMFPLGVEAWSEKRRTGYPSLLPVVVNKSGGTISSDRGIRRLPYPVEEYDENGANLQQAIIMLGGPDNGGTRVWWDKKPYNN